MNSVDNDDDTNYKQLYLTTLSQLTHLSSISTLLSSSLTTCNKIELTSIVSQHQKNMLLLEQQHSLLQSKLKQQQLLFADKQEYLKQKLQVEIRKKNLILDELDVVKAEMKINEKELKLMVDENSRLRGLINQMQNKINSLQRGDGQIKSHDDDDDSIRVSLKQLVKAQQSKINTLLQQINRLKTINSQTLQQITKMQQKLTSIEQIHRLQNFSKIECIQALQRNLKLKQQKLSHLFSIQNKKSHQDNNAQTKSYQQLQHQLHDQSRLINRLQVKISQYEQMIKSYEQNEQKIYKELIGKDKEIEEYEEINIDLVKKMGLMQNIVEELKIQRVTAELQKDQVLEKYKKSRQASRLSNLSIAKHNHMQKTACETTLTLTPTSSLANSQLQLNCSQHSLQNDAKNKKSYLSTKNKHNEVKDSFYKNKNTKTLNRKYSQVTPFEI